jgi:RecA-family ATPase
MFLGGLVAPGNRNNALYEAAIAWLGAGHPADLVEASLLPAAIRCGLSESEAKSVLASARKSNAAADGAKKAAEAKTIRRRKYEHRFEDRTGPRPVLPSANQQATRNGTTPMHSPTPPTPAELPSIIPNGAQAFVDALFQPNESIVFRPQRLDENGFPTWAGRGEVWDYETITARLAEGHTPAKLFPPKGEGCGLGVIINPATKPGLSGVTAFRHGLLEWDEGTLQEQWSWIVQSGLPVSAVVYSGGKSLHAAVRFDAPDAATFRARAQAAFDHIARLGLPAPDKCLADPSRSIRFPDYPRGDAAQELISLTIGAASWQEWEEAHADPLPEPLDLDRLILTDWSQDPDNLLGKRWLCRTRSALFVGSSGIGKSTLILTAAVRWALGKDFYGMAPVRPLRVLYIQAENDDGDVGEMLQGMLGHAFQVEEWDAAKRNMVFLSESGASGERFLERIKRLIALHRPDLVIADPLLTYVGSDITKLETVSSFFRNGINQILQQSPTRPGMIWVHHTAKPIADAKARQHWTDSDMQYLGIGSSDLTNWARSILVLQRIKTSDEDDAPTFCLQAVKRKNRAGLWDYDGLASSRIFLRHSDQGQAWLLCPEPQTQASENSFPAHRPRKDWTRLQAVLPLSRKDVLAWLEREEGYSSETSARVLRRLIASRIIMPSRSIPGHFEAPQ